jgi:hypothetical protein
MADSQFRLADLRVYSQVPTEQVIGWFPVPVGGLDSAATTVAIYVRYAEKGDETLVSTVNASVGFAKISGLLLHNQNRTAYYRLLITDNNGDTYEYDKVSLEKDLYPTGPVLGLRRNTRSLLRLGGNPVLVYQKVGPEGTDCSCYDPKLKKIIRSNCTTCYNTGKTGGYYTPVLTLAQINPEHYSNAPGDTLRQNTMAEVMLAEFPVVRPKDIIYELNTGRRYRVGAVAHSKYHRHLINQSFSATKLNPGDVEHTLPVPDPSTLTPVMDRVLVGPGERNVMMSAPESSDVNIARKQV